MLYRWRDEAVRAGRTITRIAVAFEAGRDGFWLARWLAARGIEAHVIHASSVAVSREHRREKTDRLDTELLKRGFLGWLRGERGRCSMARVPTMAEEDAKRPNRERECLMGERTRIINRTRGTPARLGIRNCVPTNAALKALSAAPGVSVGRAWLDRSSQPTCRWRGESAANPSLNRRSDEFLKSIKKGGETPIGCGLFL